MDFAFCVGGIVVEVIGGPRGSPGFSPAGFDAALKPGLPTERDCLVRVEQVDQIEAARGELLFDSGAVWKLFDDGGDYRIDCFSEIFGDEPYKSARISRDLSEVALRMRVAGLDPLQFPLDELLINALLVDRRGVELHSCGIIDRGNGLLFIGNSGHGKTTTARLWMREDVEVVSDDRVIVRAENGGWRMYGTPWHGEAEICSPASAPLRRIYVLDKSAHNCVTALGPAEAAAHLFACAFPPFHDPDGLRSVLDTLGALATSVPVARLAFANDPSAVAFVRQEAA